MLSCFCLFFYKKNKWIYIYRGPRLIRIHLVQSPVYDTKVKPALNDFFILTQLSLFLIFFFRQINKYFQSFVILDFILFKNENLPRIFNLYTLKWTKKGSGCVRKEFIQCCFIFCKIQIFPLNFKD